MNKIIIFGFTFSAFFFSIGQANTAHAGTEILSVSGCVQGTTFTRNVNYPMPDFTYSAIICKEDANSISRIYVGWENYVVGNVGEFWYDVFHRDENEQIAHTRKNCENDAAELRKKVIPIAKSKCSEQNINTPIPII